MYSERRIRLALIFLGNINYTLSSWFYSRVNNEANYKEGQNKFKLIFLSKRQVCWYAIVID